MAADTVRAEAPTRPRAGSYWFDIVFGRLVPALFFGIFIVDKAILVRDSLHGLTLDPSHASAYLDPLSQVLGFAYFCLLAFLYVIRLPRRAGDGRPLMILASFFGSFSVIFVSFLPGVPTRQALLIPALALVVVGLAYALWSLVYLQRSFSILPEARRLVTGGPYGLSRHPLYLGEGLAAIGITLPTIGWPGLLLLAFFLAAQYLRIRAEERVLERIFPEYRAYRRRVPRYLPDPRRLLAPR